MWLFRKKKSAVKECLGTEDELAPSTANKGKAASGPAADAAGPVVEHMIYTTLYSALLYYTNTDTNTNTILHYTTLYYTILYYTILYYKGRRGPALPAGRSGDRGPAAARCRTPAGVADQATDPNVGYTIAQGAVGVGQAVAQGAGMAAQRLGPGHHDVFAFAGLAEIMIS